MTQPSRGKSFNWVTPAAILATALLLGGCSALRPSTAAPPNLYALDDSGATPRPITPNHPNAGKTTLIVSPTRAAAGFDSQRIMYLREPHKLEYFSQNEWVDTPARMLGPLMVRAIEAKEVFRAVALSAGTSTGELRLDTEIIRLQQDFQSKPSQVRFTLRAYLVDDTSRRVLAWREFDSSVPASHDDPYGGVIAANEAVQRVLQSLSIFVTEGKP